MNIPIGSTIRLLSGDSVRVDSFLSAGAEGSVLVEQVSGAVLAILFSAGVVWDWAMGFSSVQQRVRCQESGWWVDGDGRS